MSISSYIRKSVRRELLRRRHADMRFCDVSDKAHLTRLGRRYVTDLSQELKKLGIAAENLSKEMTYRQFKGVMPDIVKRVGWVVSNLRKLPASIGKA